ncbi:hypothetical protein BU23DRAFT_552120 [Bimuria novae-zelandiae CBS 107.79]|uniref:F-box domain-containing protein n=1 Tax=Bimuria novae-zelandiae CBS 107.79 TaxID=1447943 RepID=A0A6A5VG35_9PLEO|nr:hypothetical protein BU23DRAFT_552120 [Bimuria novae-zelandiae CBS 107.79]
MVRAIAYGNWEQPIDARELRIPFACHIRQPSSTAPPNVSFHLFARLPAELQLRVLRFCDNPTLFQLMQTSDLIRTEATKPFFSDPEAWYCVEGAWLEMGGHPSDGLHDIDFLHYIQRLHVEYGLMSGETWTDENFRNFWRRVPHHLVGSSTASWSPPELYRRVCQLCPPDINVFVSILRRDGRLKRTLWRRVTIQEDDNETQELDELGACQYLWSQSWAITHQKKALRVLRFAAIERYHFYRRHEAFGCPAPNCEAWFERPEEYTTHVISTAARHHDDSYVLPEPYQSLFADGEKRLEQLKQRHREIMEPFLKWWGKFGSEERKVAEKEFLHELEHDPLHVQGGPFSKQR